jgi:alpha-tubulin suppressor-like RCC1 family protein
MKRLALDSFKSLLFYLFILLFFFPQAGWAANPIAAGEAHTLVIRDDTTVWAWGYNFSGQLGNGRTEDSNKPVQVFHLKNIASVAAGNSHSVALKKDGTVWVWGDNTFGQLGKEGIESSSSSLHIADAENVTAIASGAYHTMMLKNDKTVWTCGSNMYGQLGDETAEDRYVPVQVSGLQNITAISGGGEHSVAIDSSGSVWTWGNNSHGQLGNGKLGGNSSKPVEVSGVKGVTAVAAGTSHTIVKRGDGTLWAWGNNSYGQLGDGTKTNRSEPVQVSALKYVTDIKAGRRFTMALKDGKVWVWGQTGDGTGEDRITPVQVANLDNITAIGGGGLHKLSIKKDKTVWGWGSDFYGQLGNGLSGEGTDSNDPVLVLISLGINPLPDAVNALQVSGGMSPDITASDINDDGKIGIEEAAYYLELAAE